jgi:parallel beta-helix repeat protein
MHSSDKNATETSDIVGNGGDGIWLQVDSDYNIIRDNEIHSSGYPGMPIIDGSDWNLVKRNISSHNDDAWLRIETSHNTLLANHANAHASYGFWVLGSCNKLALNSACDNGSLDALQDAGARRNVWKFNSFCTSQISGDLSLPCNVGARRMNSPPYMTRRTSRSDRR